MMSRKFEDYLTPSPFCHTKMAVLLGPSYRVSPKLQPPTPYLGDIIYV